MTDGRTPLTGPPCRVLPQAAIPLEDYSPKDNLLPQGDDCSLEAMGIMRPPNRWEN